MAKEYANMCVQYRKTGYDSPYYVGDEDCLFLNIMRPDQKPNESLLPVMLWIHGGSYKYGNASGDVWSEESMQYDGRFLSLQENILHVSIQYRLNSFGMLNWKGNKGSSTWKTDLNGEQVTYKYENFYGNLALYDAELAFNWVHRNIRHFGGDPYKITIAGASAGAGVASMLSSLESVAPIIKGIIQISGDALGPTTGFLPPAEWENDQLHNLKKIAGYNNCDETSETTMLNCLKDLNQYDLLKFSHKRHYRWVNDGNLVNAPYMEMIKNSAHVPFLAGINDADAAYFSPTWVKTPNEGTPELLHEYAESMTVDLGLPDKTVNMVNYAYTDYNGMNRYEDWFIRTNAAYMATDWRYGVGLMHKQILRKEYNSDAVNYMFNFNHTAGYKLDWDLNLPVHGEERVFIFGGPFAMFDDFKKKDRDVSVLMMSQIGLFVRDQTVSWSPFPSSAHISTFVRDDPQEPHMHSAGVWLDLILKENERKLNCKSFIQCPYPHNQLN